jgi:multicomponent Na+:H+ antiporter subunit C
MEPVMAVIGALFAAAIYMMLRRSIVKLVIGLILLSNAANLLIFTVSG